MQKAKYLLLLCMFAHLLVHAQADTGKGPVVQKKWEHAIPVGFNFGAATPYSLPANVRRVYSWSPAFSPSLGYELACRVHSRWAVSAGIRLDYKGMNVEDEVLYLHTIITVKDGSSVNEFEGTFSGRNKTEVRNAYVTLPVSMNYYAGQKWRLGLGLYAAWLFSSNFSGTVSDGYIRNGGPTGEKVNIDKAEFDFGKEVRSFDWGVQGGGQYRISPRISLMASLSWGLSPLFPSSFRGMEFKMYNIYGLLGVTCHL